MANQRIHGKGGAVYLGGAKGAGGVLVAYRSEWTLNRARDYVDATAFGDPNKVYLAGLPDISGSFRGLLNVGDDGDVMLNAATSDATQIYLYAAGSISGQTDILVAHGPGFMDATVTVSNTDAARISGNFRASDAWTIDL